MKTIFPLSQFLILFPDDNVCLEEIKRLRFPSGITCTKCQKITKHYRIRRRSAYSCKKCRNQVYPLSGTIFEKTTTPLRLWFYLIFLTVQTRENISIRELQRELGVTYKTSWRMFSRIHQLMLQNKGNLLTGQIDFDEKYLREHGIEQTKKWTFFNTFEITLTQKN